MLQVLLIEDDIIDQLTLSRLIKKNKLQCKLTTATKIEEASSILKHHNFDLVICDLNLPDGIAFDLGPFIKKQAFVLLSGHIEPEIVVEAKRYGAIEVLQKNSDLKQLTAIQDLIQSMIIDTQMQQPFRSTLQVSNKNQFNIHKLLQLFDQNSSEVINILELFLEENTDKINELEQAINQEDRDYIHFVAHKLKSNFNLLGLESAQDLVQKILRESQVSTFNQLRNDFELLKKKVSVSYSEITLALKELK
jgi:DNA-binding NarL/FixJ family response regulator